MKKSMSAYPRPQLIREQWTSLNGAWKFLFDDTLFYSQPEEIDVWPLKIEVPFPPESKASGIGDQNFHRACWYQREFKMPIYDGIYKSRVLLHFGAVDY